MKIVSEIMSGTTMSSERMTMPNEVWTYPYDDLIATSSVSGVQKTRQNSRHLIYLGLIASVPLSDFAIISLLSYITIQFLGIFSSASLDRSISIAFFMSGLCIAAFNQKFLYKIEVLVQPKLAVRKLFISWTMSFFMMVVIGVIFNVISKSHLLLLFIDYFSIILLLSAIRFAVATLHKNLVTAGLIRHAVVVIGSGSLASRLVTHLKNNDYGVRINAVFDDTPHTAANTGVEISGNLNDFLSYQTSHETDTALICLPAADDEHLKAVIRRLSVSTIKIRILSNVLALTPQHDSYARFGDIPGMQLTSVPDREIDVWGHVLKSIADRFVACLALIAFAPLMITCVVGIKLSSPGPVFFRQRRIGYRNRIFEVYKFRSMHADVCDAGYLTTRNDPRVFGFGQLMRKLSLDELPQLFNVLKGDMSLVGPRPHMPEARAAGRYYYDVVDDYACRHHVKPGITGWAQVNGWRGPTETVEQIEERVKHDLYYIDNWSFGLDMLILIKTITVGFFGRNAF
ncbi:MAG: undecaprenyl-phosphate glucose phosphotransferase [Acidocella sp.]|nr:undecaprenyl-phosphate glucose phosphotransferase [Acidocella sp.]